MMTNSDYIPRQAVLDYLYQAIQDEPNDGIRLGYVRAKSVIGSMPGADVVPWERLEKYAEGRTPKSAEGFVRRAREAQEAEDG